MITRGKANHFTSFSFDAHPGEFFSINTRGISSLRFELQDAKFILLHAARMNLKNIDT